MNTIKTNAHVRGTYWSLGNCGVPYTGTNITLYQSVTGSCWLQVVRLITGDKTKVAYISVRMMSESVCFKVRLSLRVFSNSVCDGRPSRRPR